MILVEKEILRERQRFAGQVFALAASLILFVLALAQGVLYFDSLHLMAISPGQPLPALATAWLQIMTIGLLAFVGAGWKGYLAWKDSARRIGRLLDEKHAGSKNRLETSAELSQSSDALARAQREETSAYLERNPARKSYTFSLVVACCVALLILNGTLATKCIGALVKAQALAQAKPDSPKPPVRAPYAKIDIVAPESETRATPIEEVVVKGAADSDNGFSAVSLQASLNGGGEKSIPLDPALFKKGGETKFNQSLLLDELGAQPYDVISYYFKGTSLHATPLHVASQMQFIEVRPFREDVHKTLALPGMAGIEENLEWLIAQQIIISKRTWILATDQLPVTDPAVSSEAGKTGNAQDKIAGKTHALYEKMTALGFPASVIDHLSQAETSMHQAVDEIKKPDLLAANPPQRNALGELVAATKNAIKVLAMNKVSGSGPPPPKTFHDRQKLPSPSGDSANNNPLAKLDALIKQEQDIVKNLSSSDTGKPDDSSSPANGGASPKDQTAQSSPPKQGSPSPSPGQSGQQPGQNPSPGDQSSQTAQSSPSQQGSPSPSPGQSGQQPGQNPSPGDGSSQTAQSSPSPGQGGEQPGQDPSPGGQSSQTAGIKPGTGSQPGPGQNGSGLARQQSQIGKGLGDLQDQPETPATANQALAQAQDAAQNSAAKISAQDLAGALNNARLAEAAMLRAQAGMKDVAAQQLRDALAQAQQQLHEAAQAQLNATNPSEQGKVKDQADAARASLAQEKAQQSASGDPNLAHLADTLAKDYDKSGIEQKLAQLANAAATSPQTRADAAQLLSNFASQLAAKRLAMQSESKNLEDTLKRIDRVLNNANSTRGTPEQQGQLAQEMQTDLNTALDDAQALLPGGKQPGQSEKGDASASGANGGTHPHSDEMPYIPRPIHPISPAAFLGLSSPLAAFREEIQKQLDFLRDQEVLTYLDPDQSPEEYRAQVAAYYERISREAKAVAPATDQPPSH